MTVWLGEARSIGARASIGEPPRSLFSVCFAPIKRLQDARGPALKSRGPSAGSLYSYTMCKPTNQDTLLGRRLLLLAFHSFERPGGVVGCQRCGSIDGNALPWATKRQSVVPRRRWLWVGPQKGKEGNDRGPLATAPFRDAGRLSIESIACQSKPLAIQSCGLGRRMGCDCVF